MHNVAMVKPGYVRRQGAARYLGISIRKLAELQRHRIIPFSKLGARTTLFRIADLDAAVTTWRQDAIGGPVDLRDGTMAGRV